MLQSEALEILKLGKNVFLTGPAGSGKTHVLNQYVKYLHSHGIDVAVTASTGIAATHIGGMTIHSWAGLGVRDSLSDRDIDDMMQKPYLYKRFDRAKVLVIDEVSMLHHYRLDLIEWVCRQFKHSEKPFGGMQVILCGDFFQLPPVTRGDVSESEFSYKSDAWERAGFTICYLSEQHRQKDDTYLSILNEIRANAVSDRTRQLLSSRLNQEPEVGIQATKLYTHNIDVDVINHRHLDLISGEGKQYTMEWRGAPSLAETLKKSCLSPEVLHLKKGARVMFTKNDPEGRYVNGTLGVVSEFNTFGDPVVRTASGKTLQVSSQSWKVEEEGKTKAEIIQLPLRLAWAITVHKSQGMSLDAMEVDLSKSFVRGMGYVALSRVRSLSGMKLLGWNEMALEVDPEVLERDKQFRDESVDAVEDLKAMSAHELARDQDLFLKSIEPEEKVRIKRKENLARRGGGEMKKSTEEITGEMLAENVSLDEMADRRALKVETIISHLEGLLEKKKIVQDDIEYLRREFRQKELDEILEAFAAVKTTTLAPVYNYLQKKKKKHSYAEIRLARLFLEKD
jgi:ATP-dependent DNA helicase PIF1